MRNGWMSLGSCSSAIELHPRGMPSYQNCGKCNDRSRIVSAAGPSACAAGVFRIKYADPRSTASYRPSFMRIVLNGEIKTLSETLTVGQLLDEMGLAGRRVAVEVNREIVPRSRHTEIRLRDDDRV